MAFFTKNKITPRRVEEIVALIDALSEGRNDGHMEPIEDAAAPIVKALQRLQAKRGESAAMFKKELDALVKNVVEGNLNVRAKTDGVPPGELRNAYEGINAILEAVAAPIAVTSNYIDLIAKGNIPAPITTDYKGEYLVIRNNLNGLIKTANGLLDQTGVVIQAAAMGELNARADASEFQGGWNKLVSGFNEAFINLAEPLKITSGYIDQIAKGVIPETINTDYKGEYRVIRDNLNALIKMMSDILSETDVLIQGAAVGELDKRANAEMFLGGWKQLVQGVNNTVKNIAEPMQVTSNYIDQIAKGVIPETIKTDYKGEYRVIRDNLNALIKMMSDLLSETDVLIQGAANGELDKRANAEMFLGGWKQLVSGINQTLDGIVLPVNEAVDVLTEMEKGDLTRRWLAATKANSMTSSRPSTIRLPNCRKSSPKSPMRRTISQAHRKR